MGWTITVQLVRDRPLGRAEVAAPRAHAETCAIESLRFTRPELDDWEAAEAAVLGAEVAR